MEKYADLWVFFLSTHLEERSKVLTIAMFSDSSFNSSWKRKNISTNDN